MLNAMMNDNIPLFSYGVPLFLPLVGKSEKLHGWK